MIKKIMPIALGLIIALSVCVSAENTTGEVTEDTQTTAEEMPQQGRGGGRMGGGQQGNRGPQGADMQPPEMPSGGENMPGNEPPAPPETTNVDNAHNQENAASENVPPEIPAKTGADNPDAAKSTEENTGETASENTENLPQNDGQKMPAFGGGRGEMMQGGAFPGMVENSEISQEETKDEEKNDVLTWLKTYQTPVFSMVLLALAFVFVIFYKRKRY